MRPGIFFSPRRRKGRVAPVSPSFKKHPTNSPPCQTDSAMRRKGQPLPRDRHSALPAQCLRSQDGLHSAASGADSPCRPFVFTQCREETIARPKSKKDPAEAGRVRALTKPTTAKIAPIKKKSDAIFASGVSKLASCGHLRPCKLPWMQVCFLGLQAFSTLCQSVDFVNILNCLQFVSSSDAPSATKRFFRTAQ